MDVPSLVSALRDGPWEVVENRDDGELITWLPLVVSYVNRDEWLGVVSDGRWVLAVPSAKAGGRRTHGVVFAGSEARVYALLPLLDRSAARVRSEAGAAADRFGVDRQVFWNVLPWRLAIKTGIRSGRTQYVNPALDWASDLELLEEILEEVRAISGAPALSASTQARVDALLGGGS